MILNKDIYIKIDDLNAEKEDHKIKKIFRSNLQGSNRPLKRSFIKINNQQKTFMPYSINRVS